MSSPAGSLVRTSRRLVMGKDSAVRGRLFGLKCSASLRKFGLRLSSPKTLRFSERVGFPQLCSAWPNWGTTVGGVCWALGHSADRIAGTVSGSALICPTPCASDYKGSSRKGQRRRQLSEFVCGVPNPDWTEWLMAWPIGWTACAPLGTDKFHSWLRQHGEHCASEELNAPS